MNKMIIFRICIAITFVIVAVLKTLAQGNEILDAKIDVFLDPTIVKSTELKNVSFLNHIGISASQNLIIASSNFFYRIGYGNYSLCKASKEISSFCLVGNSLYYSNENTLYEFVAEGKERKVTELDFSIKQLWGGKDVIYTVSSVNEINTIHAISPKTGKCIKVHSVQHPVLGVSELGTVLYVLYENGLQALFVNNKRFLDIPFKKSQIGNFVSMAIDKERGGIYIASEKGVYRLYKKKLELVYNGTGVLCDDLDGLLILNPKIPSLLRLRSKTLYPNDSITIEIK